MGGCVGGDAGELALGEGTSLGGITPMKTILISLVAGLTAGWSAIGQTVPNNEKADLVLGQTGFGLGTEPATPSATNLRSPSCPTVDKATGKLFVADAIHCRVLRYKNVKDLENGARAEAVFGQANFSSAVFGDGAKGMRVPLALFIDTKGRLWVSDSLNHRVLMFRNAATRGNNPAADLVLGQTDFTGISSGLAANRFNAPAGLFVDAADRLWVADGANHRILRFDAVSGKGNGASADGVLGAVDFTSSTIASDAARLRNVIGMAISKNGTLYAAGGDPARVMCFPNAATLPNGADATRVLGQPDFKEVAAPETVTGSRFHQMAGIALTADDRLWVADLLANRILRFDKVATKASGAAADAVVGQRNFTSYVTGTSNRNFNRPIFPTVDAKGNLWVGDNENNRVLRFPADTTVPKLKVAKTTLNKARTKVTMSGTASDANGVAAVYYQVNSGPVKKAQGTTKWSFTAGLKAGENKVKVHAVDSVGNKSGKTTLKVRR